MKKMFNKDYLLDELNLPYSAIKSSITETSRWSIHYEIIFKDNDTFYKTWYSEGATESQEESPWEYDNDVECIEVELKEVKRLEWVVKKD